MYEELEPSYNETISLEIYNDLKDELEKEHNEVLRLQDDLDETHADLKAVIETIQEYGNKYDFADAYPKLIEFLKSRELI